MFLKKKSPKLGWRDIQHLIVLSSSPLPLLANFGWTPTASGLLFNTAFGFGLMNADRLVEIASSNWTNVPPARADALYCSISFDILQTNQPVKRNFTYNGSIRAVEHIELVLSVSYPRRGAVAVYLTSPLGTRTQLLSRRPLDRSTAGFVAWPLMSVATWAEDPRGVWQLFIDAEVIIYMSILSILMYHIFFFVFLILGRESRASFRVCWKLYAYC